MNNPYIRLIFAVNMSKFIYEIPSWPQFYWDSDQVLYALSEVRHKQGKLHGLMSVLGFNLKNEALLQTLTLDVLKSTEIEGELLNPDQVRSSIARKLGIEIDNLISSNRNVDGIVEVMLDATQNFNKKLSKERICNWHSALFPTRRSGLFKIVVGNWRTDKRGPMQVVSGASGREKVHYQAPPSKRVEMEMKEFILWFNKKAEIDSLLKAAIAHLWFITIHPFEDGNGRIARAIADMQLSRSDNDSYRFYSVSAQLRIQRNKYYAILEKTQKGNLDITDWLLWFIECVNDALDATSKLMQKVVKKTQFWERNHSIIINERQRIIINKLFDGFEGNLSSSKYAKITKCSSDTALRDINDLIDKKILLKENTGGRSTCYVLV